LDLGYEEVPKTDLIVDETAIWQESTKTDLACDSNNEENLLAEGEKRLFQDLINSYPKSTFFHIDRMISILSL
jgi:hypothetical protein